MPPDALTLAQNAPKCVWWPGSARTCWGSLQRSPKPPAGFKGPTSKGWGGEGRVGEGKGGEGNGGGEGGKGRGKGEGGRDLAPPPEIFFGAATGLVVLIQYRL